MTEQTDWLTREEVERYLEMYRGHGGEDEVILCRMALAALDGKTETLKKEE
jgi:hypothetical protein